MRINCKIYSAIRRILHRIPLIFILVMLLLHLIFPDKTYSRDESRYFAQWPVFRIQKVLSGDYSTQIERYFSDQFPFREFWILISH